MSNNCKRNPVKQPIAALPLPPRNSRHGRALLGSPSTSGDSRPAPYVKTWRTVEVNPQTNLAEVKYHNRPMTADEIIEARNSVKRALKSTNTYGKKNEPLRVTRIKENK